MCVGQGEAWTRLRDPSPWGCAAKLSSQREGRKLQPRSAGEEREDVWPEIGARNAGRRMKRARERPELGGHNNSSLGDVTDGPGDRPKEKLASMVVLLTATTLLLPLPSSSSSSSLPDGRDARCCCCSARECSRRKMTDFSEAPPNTKGPLR